MGDVVARTGVSHRTIPLVMGIVNVTPDSFSDGGRHASADAAIAHGLELLAQGAAVIDVGGESSRPGSSRVDADTEMARVLPVVEALAGHGRVSIDTHKPEVARAAVAKGATLINDITASLWPVAAELGVGWIAMHMQGEPATMQDDPQYVDVVDEVRAFLAERAATAAAAGVEEVWIDPGFGFGKTDAHNLALLSRLDRFVDLGWPVLVGTSRKGTLGNLLAASDGAPVPVDDRLAASIATEVWAMHQGASMIRAHDVRSAVQAARVVAA